MREFGQVSAVKTLKKMLSDIKTLSEKIKTTRSNVSNVKTYFIYKILSIVNGNHYLHV